MLLPSLLRVAVGEPLLCHLPFEVRISEGYLLFNHGAYL